MNRVDILAQIRRFRLRAESVASTKIKIEGVGVMTEAEAIAWIERQSEIQCPTCGHPWEKA